MKTRSLSLKKESLTDLTTEELDLVVGASGLSCNVLCLPPSDFMECTTGSAGILCPAVGG